MIFFGGAHQALSSFLPSSFLSLNSLGNTAPFFKAANAVFSLFLNDLQCVDGKWHNIKYDATVLASTSFVDLDTMDHLQVSNRVEA